MSAATYRVEIDTLKNFFASGTTDLSDRVHAFSCRQGAGSTYDSYCPPAEASVVLDNRDGAFWPDGGGAYADILKRGMMLRIVMVLDIDGAPSEQQLFAGWIDTWQFTLDQRGSEAVIINITDKSYDLMSTAYNPRVARDVLISDEIRHVLSHAIALPYEGGDAGGVFLDYSALNDCWLADPDSYLDIETSAETLAYTGDVDKPDGMLTVEQYLRILAAAEMEGFLCWDARQSKYRFWSRRYYMSNPDADITLTSDDLPTGQLLLPGDDVLNDVTVNYVRRSAGTEASVLWQIDEPVCIWPGEEREFIALYRDPSNPGVACTAIDVIPPVRGVDYAGYMASIEEGTQATNELQIRYALGAREAAIYIRNGHATAALWVTLLQVRGTPLLAYDMRSTRAFDTTSIAENGRRPFSVVLPVVRSELLASNYAHALIGERKTAYTRLPSVRFAAEQSDKLLAAAFDLGLGSCITVDLSDTPAAHTSDYFVVGLDYAYSALSSGQNIPRWLYVTLLLRLAGRSGGFSLDDTGRNLLDACTVAF